ncbi:hypothetical protein [Robbsia betulipollinis]|uniref:hypothetical protein n=1 Tax=Robbsia betulipollinis TaxID=2981849 RepID=UPI003D79D9EC
MPGAKIGRAWVFLEEDVVAYLRQRIKDQLTARLNGDAFREADVVLQAALDRQMASDGSGDFTEFGPHRPRKRGRPKRALPRLPDFLPLP